MKKILKLNNVPIWNLTDMQREFSPLAAYAVLQDFCDFAQVHCVPLPTHLETKADEKIERYQAQYLKKEFWLNIPTRRNWPSATSAMDCIQHFAKECYNAATGGHESTGFQPAQGTTVSQQMKKEWKDSLIDRKLQHICDSGKFGNNLEDIRKAVTMLAICEIAEMNALTQTFAQPVADNSNKVIDTTPTDFLHEKNAPLATAKEPYRFWYYEEHSLPEDARIRTVCIKAQPTSNQYAVVTIELYSPKTHQCVQRITLKPNEYRYCNVITGKIVTFLPDASISRDLCLLRKDLTKSAYDVVRPGEETWQLKEDHICRVAVGSRDAGFLLLKDGKVNSAFYTPARDYMVQLQFDMVMANVVDIAVTSKGHSQLLEDGTVVTNGIVEKEKCVRLHPEQQWKTSTRGVTELVLSEDRSALVALREKDAPRICFSRDGFRLEANSITLDL